MLQLTRKVGEKILVGEEIEIVVLSVSRSEVRIGIQAPRSTAILRGEIVERVVEANQHAATTAADRKQAVARLRGSSEGPKR
jgi:carbon storage regulator